MKCNFGGGFKEESECDHVTCECGHQFCWACGVPRQVPLAHDNRWHKRSCPYHTKLSDVSEAPKYMPNCPECQKMPGKTPCPFPPDDGYPKTYIPRRNTRVKTVCKPRPGVSLELEFNDCYDDSIKTLKFTHKPIGIRWTENEMPITVSGVSRGSHAERAGVKKGWFLRSVGGENLFSYEYDEAVGIVQGNVNKLADD